MARILVADDSRLSRYMVVEVLQNQGYETIEAADGKAALAAFRRESPDCVIVDLLMPVMNGRQFVLELRAGGSEVPVIVVSANLQASSRDECEQLGISAILNKPIKEDALVACVGSALENLAEIAKHEAQQ